MDNSVPSINENQYAYDQHQDREKACLAWLKKQTKLAKYLILFASLTGVLNGVMIIVQSWLLTTIIHQLVIEKQVWTSLNLELGMLIIAVVLRCVFNYYCQTLGLKAAVCVKRKIRNDLLDKFTRLGPAFVKQHHSGELSALTLEHTEALEGYFARYLPQQYIAAIFPLIIIFVVFPVNWVVGIIFLVTGPLVPIFMALVGMGAASAQRNQFLALTRMGGYFLDRIQGITTLVLFDQAQAELDRIATVAMDFRKKTMQVLRIAFLSSAVLEFFSAVSIALVAVYVGLGLLGLINFGPAKQINLQQALFVLLLAPEFFNPLKQLAVFYHDKAAALGAADPILHVLEHPEPSIKQSSIAISKYCLEVNHLSFGFKEKSVIDDLSFSIKAGEKIALIGESGAGKSTLFNLLLGFDQPKSGEILLNGQHLTRENAANMIAWAGQNATIFYGSIAENIHLHNSELDRLVIHNAARVAGVTEFSDQLNDGLDSIIGESGYGLSGGQIQRIGLARALAKPSQIVLLDEPTAHLDPAIKKQVMEKIVQFCEGKTLIVASHDEQVIENMDRIIKLTPS